MPGPTTNAIFKNIKHMKIQMQHIYTKHKCNKNDGNAKTTKIDKLFGLLGIRANLVGWLVGLVCRLIGALVGWVGGLVGWVGWLVLGCRVPVCARRECYSTLTNLLTTSQVH